MTEESLIFLCTKPKQCQRTSYREWSVLIGEERHQDGGHFHLLRTRKDPCVPSSPWNSGTRIHKIHTANGHVHIATRRCMNSCEYSRLGSRESDFQAIALLQAVEKTSGASLPDLPSEGFHLIQAFIIQFKHPVSAFSSGINMLYEFIMS